MWLLVAGLSFKVLIISSRVAAQEQSELQANAGILKHIPAFIACGSLWLSSLMVIPPAQASLLTTDEQRTVSLFKKNTAAVVNVTNLGMR